MKIWTIEINADDDFANACAYHVDEYPITSARNLRAACEGKESNRWLLVGLALSLNEALDKCEKTRQHLCKMHNKIPYGIQELLEKMSEENE